MSEEKNEERRSRNSALLWGAFLIAVLAGMWVIASRMVARQIIDTTVQNIEELARHDEQAIMTSLENRWETLSGIGEALRREECGSTEELQKELAMFVRTMGCHRLSLVREDGWVVNSAYEEKTDPQMLEVCQSEQEEFARRVINEDPDDRTEEIRVGVALSQPITVEGAAYRWLVARLAIDTFENELKIDSYGGRGYSSVIGPDGSYIVSIRNDPEISHIDNFFDMLEAGTLPEDKPLEWVREMVEKQQRFSLEYIRPSGKRAVVIFDPMGDLYWCFISVVPRAVFEEQTNTLVIIFLVMMLVVLLAVAVAVVTMFRRRTRLLAIERKHRTELSQALSLAEQANRAKTIFLNNMSHDIRTPMNAIIGFTALASTHIDNQERVKDYLGKIAQSSNHLLSLINDVLDMSRIESGKMNLDEKPENLAEILHSLRNIIQADIHAKQLELYIDTVDVMDEDICCDKLRLNQVLLNIMSNAIKFTPPGGTISLRTTERAVSHAGYGTYEFRIKDTGIGMKPDFLEKIFVPFSQERSSSVSGIQGTGLGMSITKNIVDMMGGEITVSSEEGAGTEFVVTLEFKLQGGHREAETIETLKGLRSLVVDDDMNACQSVAQMLRQIGMRSEWTMYGKEAVARTEEALQIGDAYRVYIIDWLMPDMNGIETTRRIRKVVGDEAPIIILSAYDWSDIEAEAREAGVTDFISKPLFPSDLREVLLRTCGEAPTAAEPAPPPVEVFQGRRVLLVEDNDLNREIAVEILEGEGFLVQTAENGLAAVDAVREAQPGAFDVVLMDIQMPIMDGYEAARAIRNLPDPVKANVPIIAMTANAFEEDRQQAYDAGMNAHVAKPIEIPALISTLQDIMAHRTRQLTEDRRSGGPE